MNPVSREIRNPENPQEGRFVPTSGPVSVIIVSFNTIDKLRKCLTCLETEPEIEVIVVDNASQDGSVEMVRSEFPNVICLALEENIGFGRANNRGMEIAKHEIILFLNSDAYAHPGAIKTLASAFTCQTTVAAGGKLLNLDGTIQESCTKMLNLWHVFTEQFMIEPLLRMFRLGYWITWRAQRFRYASVPQVMGACLMIRKSADEWFDERFFLYCEDTELCYRLNSHGDIVYVRDAEFTHELGASSTKDRWKSVSRYNAGKELFFQIHFGRFASLLCWILNRLGTILRILVSLTLAPFRPNHRQKLATFWKVLTQKP
jgi:N-acetylglucosaminyl-diphospho-decaprenol L-rhamnosyltransferase